MVLLVAASAATAADTEFTRPSLKGLNAVEVLVESLSTEAERDGLNKTSIQTDVQLKLRQAGIRVLTRAERFETPGWPFLYIDVAVKLRTDVPVYAYSINVELEQSVRLDRAPSIQLSATTWSVGSVGAVGRNKLRTVRDDIKDHVDEFINAYLSVNPKK
jgi:hypothetical protein